MNRERASDSASFFDAENLIYTKKHKRIRKSVILKIKANVIRSAIQ